MPYASRQTRGRAGNAFKLARETRSPQELTSFMRRAARAGFKGCGNHFKNFVQTRRQP